MALEIAFSQTDADHTFTYTNFGGQSVTETREVTGVVFAPDAPGTYPVVFYSHGHAGSPTAGGAINARALADLGYIVVAPRHLDSLDFPFAIRSTFSIANPDASLHRIADMQFLLDVLPDLMTGLPGYDADASLAAIAGHSHGAYTAALLAGAVSSRPGLEIEPGNEFGLTELADARFAEALLLSPQGATGPDSTFTFTPDSWDTLTIPALTITGTADESLETPNYRDRLDGFDYGPAGGKHAIVLAGADHAQVGGGDVSNTAINAEVAGAMAAFLDAYVKGDAAALALISDAAAYAAAHPLFAETYEKALAGASGSGIVRGDGAANTLLGLSTNDTILGGGGDDTMAGGAGNDVYVVDSAGDGLSEAADRGIDTAATPLNNFSLYAIANVERVVFTGTGNFTGRGNGLDNRIEGAAGNDRFVADQGGADRYFGDAGVSDQMDFRPSAVGAIVNLTTGIHGGAAAGDFFSSIEYLYGSDTAGDTFTGGAFNDHLFGYGGDDTLSGLGGNDYLYGGEGDDEISGGAFLDFLYGNAGADDFNYAVFSDSSPTSADRDRVYDFQAGVDDIDVSAIDASTAGGGNNAFTQFLGAAAFTAEGQVRWYQSGANTVIEFNTTGTSGAEMQIQLQTFTAATLAAGDFIG